VLGEVDSAESRGRRGPFSPTEPPHHPPTPAALPLRYLPLNASTEGLTKWTPFGYYLNSDPLVNGMDWWHGLVLLVLTIVFVGLAAVLFQRRDLRQRG